MAMAPSILQWICITMCVGIKAVSSNTLTQGDYLDSASQLDSPNALFTLRFYAPESNQSTNHIYLAIVFNSGASAPVSHKAIWIANRDDPILKNSDPQLTLSSRGDLTITRHLGLPIQVYTAQGSNTTTTNITATLTDTGNFILLSNATQVLWQSYDHPTDTLLSGMKLSANNRITSWLTPSNPAPGPFSLEWDPSPGELVIRRRGMAYWRSGRLVDYHNDSMGNVKNFENFYLRPDRDSFNYNLTSGGDYFVYTVIQGRTMESRKVTSGWLLDETGNVSTIDDRGLRVVMASLCNGYSSIGDGYSKGCELWELPKCRNRNQVFDRRSGDFRDVRGRSVMPTIDGNQSLILSDCRDTCWKWSDCECAGYANYMGGDYGCSYWIGGDLEWVQDNSGADEKIYVLQSPPKAKAKSYIGIILGEVGAILLLMLAFVLLIMRNRKVKREERLHELLTLEGHTELDNRGANGHQLKLFTYASIISATNNFSSNNKLGEGGFGPVYKGRTGDGQDIAVKLLSRKSGQGLLEFKNELILISELQHVNLVKLIGFCIHKEDKMIIYDYMPNKSLDCFLFSPSGREQLDWEKRFNIIEGTAQGLLYLHKHSRLRIIHRDMKPNNILLDHNMTPKISDFGLARIFKEDTSEVNTNRRVGTYGYMAPEYAMQGIFSVKSDVYSYGVLVLEIVSGRKNNSFHDIEGPLSIVEYVRFAWELWRKDDALQLMDPMLKESCVLEQLRKCIHIGLLCVENHAVDRPTIEDVLFMLKNETATLPMPKNPSFITRNSVFQQVDKATPQQSSDNQVTLSQLSGR
ncbi:G-type lectin S-receptor-like serine/threonine-protein kinase CES101 isoform X1 [Salvia splendens]|uniref:G-type lectin S-receptor-like serine/threonine-protein kinase CES101 isoform X1 n=2 Tax=Salvia splendens TaxID=180675 RepID=UPI001C279BCB|nr:G-type lectin S-receptor-like serine/threonine-protein kinase CES101 isoform X1 [Salvia splendens]